MQIMKPSESAKMEEHAYCTSCGWPVVFACCNDEMGLIHEYEDWWMYCSNQGCKHHKGEPYGQHHTPSFVGVTR